MLCYILLGPHLSVLRTRYWGIHNLFIFRRCPDILIVLFVSKQNYWLSSSLVEGEIQEHVQCSSYEING